MDSNLRAAEEAFDRISELPESERADALAAIPDDAVRGSVERLLAAESAAGASFLSRPAVVGQGTEAEESLPTSIGEYEVVRLIGEGGMGAVYEARQKNPERSVAVKVVRAGAATREIVARFRREAAILGAMQHPGIAAIYEAGTGSVVRAEGVIAQPYFVMELVKGLPLGEYVAERRPTLRGRLELFAKICDAVDHAHAHGVVHRDLKPGNILVVEADGREMRGVQPKVLDFGVARAAHTDQVSGTLQTSAMQVIGTLPYMSPEQIHPSDSTPVNLRSDVYSLGVILYEMLAERHPYDLSNRSIADAARTITETEPTPLGRVRPELAGDLTLISQMALAKEPSRRYSSAGELAREVRRFLEHEPVLARPATTLYHIRKFTQRNRALVAGAGMATGALVAGLIASTVMYLRADEARSQEAKMNAEAQVAKSAAIVARNEARDETAKVKLLNDYLLEGFIKAASPARDGHEVKLLSVLYRAAETVDERFKDQPAMRSSAHVFFAQAFNSLDMPERAVSHSERAIEAAIEAGGPLAVAVFDASIVHANQLQKGRRFEDADAHIRRAIATFTPVFGADDQRMLRARGFMGGNLQILTRYAEAEPILREVIPKLESALGPSDPNVTSAMSNLAAMLMLMDRGVEGMDIYKELMKRAELNPAIARDERVGMRNNLVAGLLRLKRNAEAAAEAKTLAAEAREVFPAGHRFRGFAMMNAAVALSRNAEVDEAEKLFLTAYDEWLAGEGPAIFELEQLSARIRDFYIRALRAEQAAAWTPVPMRHRLLYAQANEGESISKGVEELRNRLVALGVSEENEAASVRACELLREAGDSFAPVGSVHRVRFFLNLARAAAALGQVGVARTALAEAKSASGGTYSVDEAALAAVVEPLVAGATDGGPQ